MQTFVPEGSDLKLGFTRLDYKRLGKQRVEAWQILNVLRGVDNEGNPKNHKGWVNHPATKMWHGYTAGLAFYGMLCCQEWIRRGYNDTMLPRFTNVFLSLQSKNGALNNPVHLPDFLDDIADSHKSNLLRKEPDHYRQYWSDVPDDMPYDWRTP